MNPIQLCGAMIVLLLIFMIGIASRRQVKTAADFETGSGKAGIGTVSGMMMGTMIGGSSTIGTAQLAYMQGISAWWYTLSCGLGCLVIALLYVKPFRHAEAHTLMGIIRREYGGQIELVMSVLVCATSFIAIIPQLIASSAILPAIFPGISTSLSVVFTTGLMLVYVIFGGALGTGEMGKVKTVLLYATILIGTGIVLKTTGLQPLWISLEPSVYFNLFANGVGKEVSKSLSVVLGIVTAQIYMQAVLAGRSDKTARRGEFLSALLIPPVGLGCVLIGMFMRVNHPALPNAKEAFPQFVQLYMPDFLGGIVMATLLLAIVGSGAGSLLAISTIIHRDIVIPLTHRFDSPKQVLLRSRLYIVLAATAACVLSTGTLDDSVLFFTTMAVGLRAVAVFVPLMCAMLLPGKISRKWVLASVIVGTVLAMTLTLWDIFPIDGLGAGIIGSAFCCLCGFFSKRTPRRFRNTQ